MTTIAFDGKTLATDSRTCTGSDTIVGERTKKLFKVGGWWLAFSGNSQNCAAALQWFKAGMPEDKPKLENNFSVLTWNGHRLIRYECGLVPMPQNVKIAASGSGIDIALGAMAAGATAAEAVRIASRFDPFTNNRVQASR